MENPFVTGLCQNQKTELAMFRQTPDTKEKSGKKNKLSALLSVQESPKLPQFFYAPVMETGGTHRIIFALETSE